MKNLFIIIVLLIGCNLTEAQVIGNIFPAMEAETVEDKKVMLPQDTKGKYTLLGLAYSKKSEDELNSWFGPIYNKFVRKPEGLLDCARIGLSRRSSGALPLRRERR